MMDADGILIMTGQKKNLNNRKETMLRCNGCEKTLQLIAQLQDTIDELNAKVDSCTCVDIDNKDKGRTCGDCLYLAEGVYCWEKHEYRMSDDRRCKDYVDYEKWFEKHGIKQDKK